MNANYVLIHIQLVSKVFFLDQIPVRMLELPKEEVTRVVVANHVTSPEITTRRFGRSVRCQHPLNDHYSSFNVFYLKLLQASVFFFRITTVLICKIAPIKRRFEILLACFKRQSDSKQIVRITISLNARHKPLPLSLLAQPISVDNILIRKNPLERCCILRNLKPLATVKERRSFDND